MATRGILTAIFLFITVPLSGIKLFQHFKSGKEQFTFIISGVLIAYMWLTIAYSEKFISAAMASLLLTGLVPISWIIATFITREKQFNLLNFIGIIIATSGIIIMIGYKHILHVDHTLWACLLYISGLISFTAAATINKSLVKNVLPQITISFNVLYMAIILTATAFIMGNPLQETFSARNLSALVALSIGSTGIGYLIYFYLSHHTGLVFAALSSYIVPAIGFALGFILLQEHVHIQQAAGLLVVFTGMWFIQRKAP